MTQRNWKLINWILDTNTLIWRSDGFKWHGSHISMFIRFALRFFSSSIRIFFGSLICTIKCFVSYSIWTKTTKFSYILCMPNKKSIHQSDHRMEKVLSTWMKTIQRECCRINESVVEQFPFQPAVYNVIEHIIHI